MPGNLLLSQIGFPRLKKGACYGFAALALLYYLREQFDTYHKITQDIRNIEEDLKTETQITEKLRDIIHPWIKKTPSTQPSLPSEELTQKEEKLAEFLFQVAIHQQPTLCEHRYPKNNKTATLAKQDVVLSRYLLSLLPEFTRHNAYLYQNDQSDEKQADATNGLHFEHYLASFTTEELTKFLEKIKEKYRNKTETEKTIPFGILVLNSNHCLFLTYNEIEKKWLASNHGANYRYPKTEELTRLIKAAFPHKNAEADSRITLSLKVYRENKQRHPQANLLYFPRKEVIDTYSISEKNMLFLLTCMENQQSHVETFLKDHPNMIQCKKPFIYSCQRGFFNIIKMLFKHPSFEATPEDISYGFWAACCNGHLEIAEHLKSKGANINFTQKNVTSLYYAAANNHFRIVKMLMESRANTCLFEITPLFIACQKGNTEIAKYLIETDKENKAEHPQINIPITTSEAILTTLNLCEKKRKHAFQTALKTILFKNSQSTDIKNFTPLDVAICAGHLEIIALLINERIKIITRNTFLLFLTLGKDEIETLLQKVNRPALLHFVKGLVNSIENDSFHSICQETTALFFNHLINYTP